MKQVLKVGIEALVAGTHMDSGRAAAHWIIVPGGGSVSTNPGARAPLGFPNPDYGQAPVGRRGDKLTERGDKSRVVIHVVGRETSKVINRSIKGRKPATHFVFHSSVPEKFDDQEKDAVGDGSNYRENAKLEQAKEAALQRMQTKFNSLVIRGQTRVNPLR